VGEINGGEDTHVFVGIGVSTLDEIVCGVHVEWDRDLIVFLQVCFGFDSVPV
jgi:hypothetical protein